MAVEVVATRRRFTRAEYYRMAEAGILRKRDRVELIRGEIVEMSPIGRRHRAFVDNLNALLAVRLGDRAIVSIQQPVILSDDTEPEPDLTVLRRRPVPYKEREASRRGRAVAHRGGRQPRSPTTDPSSAGSTPRPVIPEYWVVDLRGRGRGGLPRSRHPTATGTVRRVGGPGRVMPSPSQALSATSRT